MAIRILRGHVMDRLAELPDESVHCVVTSPPYWGLRDYGLKATIWGGAPACQHDWDDGPRVHRGGANGGGEATVGRDQSARDGVKSFVAGAFCGSCGAWAGQLGLEPTPDLFVEHLVDVFREVRRVLRKDGIAWVNMGDSYATGAGKVGDHPGGGEQGGRWRGDTTRHRDEKRRPHGAPFVNGRGEPQSGPTKNVGPMTQPNRMPIPGLKPKDLVGVPWMMAFALRADGWWLRQDVIWHKPNPMPESVLDRCTKSHEYLFLLTKSERYFYDAEAVAEPVVEDTPARAERGRSDAHKWADGGPGNQTIAKVAPSAGTTRAGNKVRTPGAVRGVPGAPTDGSSNGAVASGVPWEGSTRNKRSVWTITTKPFTEAHFATFPVEIPENCIKAGCPPGGTVLDPFFGAGTTGLVADRLQRNCIGIELNPEYADMAERRIRADAPLFAKVGT